MSGRVALVVPTIRGESFSAFVKRWDPLGLFRVTDLIVVEDNPEPTMKWELPTNYGMLSHYTWKNIEEELGEQSWIIPRRSDTVRSFGYYKAWKLGYDYILTLDDDCYPPGEEDNLAYASAERFVNGHIRYLEGKTRWFNTLNSVKPRGIPFYNVGTRKNVVLNHGLWTNVLDYDAPYQLVNPVREQFSFDNRIVPHGSYFPMCGMNVMWRSDVTVLMYHLLMGQMWVPQQGYYDNIKKLPFDRFGDIWCGIFMKKIVDLKGWSVSTGMPYIRHERASNPFTNLKKEAAGIEVNEKLWEYVDAWRPICPDAKSLSTLYRELGHHITSYDQFPEHNGYFARLGRAMVEWSSLFEGP